MTLIKASVGGQEEGKEGVKKMDGNVHESVRAPRRKV